MSKRSLFAGAGIAAVGALAFAAPAVAAPYPPTPIPGVITVPTTTPVAGQPFVVTLPGGSCDPGSPVDTTANGVDKGTGTADGAGGYSKSLTLGEPGTYTIVMSCNKGTSGVSYTGPRSSGGSAATFTAVAYSTAAKAATTYNRSYTITVTVTSSGGGGNNNGNGGNSDLAKTGADNTLTIAAIGGGLILVGGAAVYATRRRERSAR